MRSKRFIFLAKLGILETENEQGRYEIQKIDPPEEFKEENELTFEPPLLESDEEARAIFNTISIEQLERLNESNDLQNHLLEQAVVNQLETDLEEHEYDSISEMLQLLINNEESKKILIEYLSDSAKENWIEGKTTIRY